MVFSTLAHHIDLDWMREAYRRTRKDGAAGVDGMTAAEYAQNLEDNLRDLLERFKSGSYHAPPVRRVHIPKGDGTKTRPIGIPSFEDKVLQRAVSMVLEPVYEQDFLDCSYGFRPGRSAHQALQAIRDGLMKMGGGWILEIDIQGFFDALDRGHLRGFLDQRVRDGVLRRTINKWLKAGVQESGCMTHPETGSPQGGVISPLLSNIYLHEVMDAWFEREVKPRLSGRAFMVRYADDLVVCFSSEADARRVAAVVPKRFARYGLALHPEKTRLVRFTRPSPRKRGRGPGTFDLLGFTHFWGRSRKGYWVIWRRTAKSRMSRSLRAINQWCRDVRHWPVKEQHRILSQKLRGHFGYYGITGNAKSLADYSHWVHGIWRKWLDRRSHRARMTWERFERLRERYPLPPPRAVHSEYRYAANP